MKQRLLFCSATLGAFLLCVAAPLAGPAKHARLTLDWDDHVNRRACDVAGKPIIDITEKVRNDADSGVAGNYWAFDDFTRTIQVFQQGDGGFCAVVKFDGEFESIAGQISPAGDLLNILDGDEHGKFTGGYIATFDGALLTTPRWKKKGNVGTVDYACDVTGNCPGYVDWIGQYFGSTYTNFDQPWWGWIYHGGKAGIWINAINGNLGNIVEERDGG